MRKLKQAELHTLTALTLILIVGIVSLFLYFKDTPSELAPAPEASTANPSADLPEVATIETTEVGTTPSTEVASSTELASSTEDGLTKETTTPAKDTSASSKSSPISKVEEAKKTTPEPTPKPATPPPTLEPSVNSAAMLQAHNAVRTKHGLAPLAWSASLAKSAQRWSDVLKGESCKMRHDYDSPYGENIFWKNTTGGDIKTMISVDQESVTWWANEEKYYSYDTDTCRKGEQCGHYTQIVWADTTEVGCGVSSCIAGDSRTDIWVCRYNPAGNVIGQKPY